jgi:hypothetical protein
VSVDPTISRAVLEEELAATAPLAASCGWQVTPDLDNLVVTVRMKSAIDGEEFILEAKCDNYRELPPLFEFIHPADGTRGTQRCYPSDQGGSNYFHTNPCICIQWNRKAYGHLGGPHGEWVMTAWADGRPGTLTLGDMFFLVHRQINDRTQYRGRMAPS